VGRSILSSNNFLKELEIYFLSKKWQCLKINLLCLGLSLRFYRPIQNLSLDKIKDQPHNNNLDRSNNKLQHLHLLRLLLRFLTHLTLTIQSLCLSRLKEEAFKLLVAIRLINKVILFNLVNRIIKNKKKGLFRILLKNLYLLTKHQ
jgi:hypothetical protein